MTQNSFTGTNISIIPGTNGVSVTYTLTNTGNVSITANIAVSLQAQVAPFGGSTTTPTPLTIAAGASTNLTATFPKALVSTLLAGGYSVYIEYYTQSPTLINYAECLVQNALTITTNANETISGVSITSTTT